MQLNGEIIHSFKTNGPFLGVRRVLGFKPTARWFKRKK